MRSRCSSAFTCPLVRAFSKRSSSSQNSMIDIVDANGDALAENVVDHRAADEHALLDQLAILVALVAPHEARHHVLAQC